MRGQTRNSGKGLLELLRPQEGAETSNRFPCSLPKEGRAGSLYGVRVGTGPGVGPEGCLRWLAHPFGDVVCRGHVQDPAFAPNTLFLLPAPQKWQLGFFCLFVWSFCILLSRTCPNCVCTQLFSVPMVSLYFVAQGDFCPGASTAAKGPRSLVPACLILTTFVKMYN